MHNKTLRLWISVDAQDGLVQLGTVEPKEFININDNRCWFFYHEPTCILRSDGKPLPFMGINPGCYGQAELTVIDTVAHPCCGCAEPDCEGCEKETLKEEYEKNH